MKKITEFENHLEITLFDEFIVKISKKDRDLLDIFPSWQIRKGYVSCERWIETEYGSVLQSKYLHRLITWPTGKHWQIDHANRDKLDNRRENLRRATGNQNSANRVMLNTSKSGYKGVYSAKRNLKKPWRMQFCGKTYGLYETAEQAALAYNYLALEKYGDFAVLNKISIG